MSEIKALQSGSGLFRHKFLKYFEIAKVNYFNSSAYLLNLLSRSAIVIIRIWIFTQLYKSQLLDFWSFRNRWFDCGYGGLELDDDPEFSDGNHTEIVSNYR